MENKSICFKVVFKPTLGWADEAYLGNMLAEVLGIMARNTSAFEFEIKEIKEDKPQD